MPTSIITLPSGLTGEVRNMKAKELAILADPNNGKAPKLTGKKVKTPPLKKHPLDPIYNGCWLSTNDAGPYGFSVGEPVPWGKVLVADRFIALINIRQLTYGDFSWKVKCKNTSCEMARKGFQWDLDLTTLDVKPFPDATIEKIRKGDLRFPITIDGKECVYELLTGSQEANRPELSADVPSHRKMLAQVASRLVQIDGKAVDPESEETLDWVGDLDLQELYRVDNAMNAVDGGVETRTLISCPECGEEWDSDIPFGDRAFLTPGPTR